MVTTGFAPRAGSSAGLRCPAGPADRPRPAPAHASPAPPISEGPENDDAGALPSAGPIDRGLAKAQPPPDRRQPSAQVGAGPSLRLEITMKAAVCREFRQSLAIEQVELAEPRPGEVKVRIAACAICHSDLFFLAGAWGGELPAVAGHEAAGIVEEVGRRGRARRAGRPRRGHAPARLRLLPLLRARRAPAVRDQAAARSVLAAARGRRLADPPGPPDRRLRRAGGGRRLAGGAHSAARCRSTARRSSPAA